MPTFECPVCRRVLTVAKPDDAPFRPFCSQRCKMVDLGRWLDGTYRLSEPLNEGPPNDPAGASDVDAPHDDSERP